MGRDMGVFLFVVWAVRDGWGGFFERCGDVVWDRY